MRWLRSSDVWSWKVWMDPIITEHKRLNYEPLFEDLSLEWLLALPTLIFPDAEFLSAGEGRTADFAEPPATSADTIKSADSTSMEWIVLHYNRGEWVILLFYRDSMVTQEWLSKNVNACKFSFLFVWFVLFCEPGFAPFDEKNNGRYLLFLYQ